MKELKNLVVLKPFKLQGKQVEVGVTVQLSPRDARIFVAIGKCAYPQDPEAADAVATAPASAAAPAPAPAPAPVPEPASAPAPAQIEQDQQPADNAAAEALTGDNPTEASKADAAPAAEAAPAEAPAPAPEAAAAPAEAAASTTTAPAAREPPSSREGQGQQLRRAGAPCRFNRARA